MSAAVFWLISVKVFWMFFLFAIPFAFFKGGCGSSETPLTAKYFGHSRWVLYTELGFGFTIGAAVGPLVSDIFTMLP